MDIAEIRKKAKGGTGRGAKPVPPSVAGMSADVKAPTPEPELQSPAALTGHPPVTRSSPLVPDRDPLSAVNALDRLFAAIGEGQFAGEEAYQTALTIRDGEAEGALSQFLAFQLGTEEYALDIGQISEIIKPREYTDIPRVPDYILGLVSLRGVVVPIIDLRLRFQMGRVADSSAARIIVCRSEDVVAGLLVDKIKQVVRIDLERVEPPPAVIGGVDRHLISGIGRFQGRMIIMLNLSSVLEIVSG